MAVHGLPLPTVFGEAPFVPLLAFPFVKLFDADEEAALETVMMVLLNWAGSWLETFPRPPAPVRTCAFGHLAICLLKVIQVLAIVHRILTHFDAPLAAHLRECGVDSTVYAWPLLRSAFSEVLTRSEWLAFWDHLVVDIQQPQLLLFAVVAYLRYFRSALLSIRPPRTRQASEVMDSEPACTETQFATVVEEITAFVRRQNALNVRGVLDLMYAMHRSAPSSLWNSDPWPGTPLYAQAGQAIPAGASDTAVQGSDSGPYYLPAGQYPLFLRYPKYVVDFQVQERKRIEAEEAAALERQERLHEFQAQG